MNDYCYDLNSDGVDHMCNSFSAVIVLILQSVLIIGMKKIILFRYI